MPIEVLKNYISIRIRPKSRFTKFRTIDVGNVGGLKATLGIKKGKSYVQRYLVEIEALRRGRKSTWYALKDIYNDLSPKGKRELVNVLRRLGLMDKKPW